jgi:hypothetical protein
MSQNTLEVVPLGRAELTTGEILSVGQTVGGHRTIATVTAARFEGERFAARLIGPGAADWALIRSDGIIEVSVRLTLETDDGALVAVTYEGDIDGQRGAWPVLSRMRFETADERYAWLNRAWVVARGTFAAGAVRYELFELR